MNPSLNCEGGGRSSPVQTQDCTQSKTVLAALLMVQELRWTFSGLRFGDIITSLKG